MPRGRRILINNSYYHIINRGNQKQDVFRNPPDYEQYLKIIKHYKRRYVVKIFGYCLMPNHIHFILEPSHPEKLAKFMQCITQTYTAWFNAKYHKAGHLWQGRFKSMNIDKNESFLGVVFYVEANPVRAGLASSVLDYRWSSYRYRTLGETNELLDIPYST